MKRPELFAATLGVIFLISITGSGTGTVNATSVQSESEQNAQVQKARSSDVMTVITNGSDKVELNYDATREAMLIRADLVTENTTVSEIIRDPVFRNFGRLIFPVDRKVTGDMTLADISSSNVYVWYYDIRKEKTVEIVNNLKNRAEKGETIFWPIYSEREMASDPSKKDTGLFFFAGKPGAKFAVMNAGGGFAYVGAMHDSFPHALEVSKKGYNAFALIYRPDDPYSDLARAIAFIFDNAEKLGVDVEGYSLWGGSAGARMAAVLSKAGSMAAYGRPDISQAAAVIMQYTGYSAASEKDAPTYACVGTNDGIANWRTMQSRLETLDSYGIPTEFHAYEGLSHGFGLGTGTVAEGWVDEAVAFWENQM